jgi:hypothetical protein
VAAEDTLQSEVDVQRRLLALAVQVPRPVPWERIATPDLRFAARAAYFLLDAGRDDAESFLTYTLERLLSQLTRITEQRQVEYRGRVRGRIVWPATFKARYLEEYDPSRYVCREVRREFDTPENQLLRYVVEQIGKCLGAVPATLRAGTSYLPDPAAGRRLPDPAARLSRMEAALNTFRPNARLREVSLPQRIEESHLLRAETSRTEEYGSVARLYRRYRATVESPAWDGFAQTGRRLLLLPAQADAEGEPWLQIGAALLRA